MYFNDPSPKEFQKDKFKAQFTFLNLVNDVHRDLGFTVRQIERN